MSKQRYVNTKFWDDPWAQKLDPIEKLLFLYLLTNPLTTIAGVYEIAPRRVAFDTGIDAEMVEKLFQRFTEAGKIIYRDGWLLIVNFVDHQARTPKILTGIKNVVSDAPAWIQAEMKIIFDRLSIPYTYPPNYLNLNSNSNSNNPEPSADVPATAVAAEKYENFEKDILEEAISQLKAQGNSERSARGFIGMLLKDTAKHDVIAAFLASQTAVDIKACMTAALKKRKEMQVGKCTGTPAAEKGKRKRGKEDWSEDRRTYGSDECKFDPVEFAAEYVTISLGTRPDYLTYAAPEALGTEPQKTIEKLMADGVVTEQTPGVNRFYRQLTTNN